MSDTEGSTALFSTADAAMAAIRMSPLNFGAYVFCDGPGAQLGIRSCAMALRAWQTLRAAPCPTYAFHSLQLAAATQLHGSEKPFLPFSVVCDARRDAWHAVHASEELGISEVHRLSLQDLEGRPGRLFEPAGFLRWAAAPQNLSTIPYNPQAIEHALCHVPLLREVTAPAPWLPQTIDYKLWSGERHRAPTVR